MFSKIIFALAMVCVVNASVLTASDDGPDVEMASTLKRCDLQSCENLCHRHNFPGGSCVNGRCKCDNVLKAEDGDSDFSLSDLENSFSQIEDIETDVTASQDNCKEKACNWVCRILKKTNGSCVDGRCKCEKSRNAEEKPMGLEVLVPLIEEPTVTTPRACNTEKCNQMCHRHKHAGGWCRFGQCRCF